MTRKIIVAITFIATLTSCLSNRKLNQLKLALQNVQRLETALDSTLQALEQIRNAKNTVGQLDDTTSTVVKKIIDRNLLASNRRLDSLIQLQQQISGSKLRRKDYFNMVAIVTKGKNVVDQKIETVDFIDQLLKQNTSIKFNTAAFFPPGGYQIADNKLPEAKQVFTPLIDSLIAFIVRFPKMKLYSNIIASGYADGQGYTEGSDLFAILSNLIGKANPTKEELNEQISRLRADEIATILRRIFLEKISSLPSLSNHEARFFKIGKGEEYPNKTITDYQVEDERRRIVVLFWSALPSELP